MNLFDLLTDVEKRDGSTHRIYGLVVGIVTNNQDPDQLGRVKVRFPWLSDADESNWARVAAPMAGNNRGFYFLPEVNDEVLIAFEQGDPRVPYVIGALWNGKDLPPVKNADGKNSVRLIKSPSGHIIRLVDEAGMWKIEIVDKSGNNSLVFDTAANTITITSGMDIVLSAAQGSIRLEAKTVEIKSSDAARLESAGVVDITAGANMDIKGQTINLN